MQLRRNGDGQLLPELRGKEAAACRKRLDVHLRPEEHRKILLRLRQAAPCRGLDLRLRHGESGKFCQNCGAKKPANEPQYRCDKCGWQPEDPRHPPKFCPECGDPFDFNDQV